MIGQLPGQVAPQPPPPAQPPRPGALPPAPGPVSRRVDPTLIADALWKHRMVIAICVLIVPAMAVWGRSIVGVKYKSSAQILVQESVKLSDALKDLNLNFQVNSRLPAIDSLVRSRDTVVRVLTELGRLPEDMARNKAEAAIGGFKAGVQVFSEGGGLIRLSFTAGEPEFVLQALDKLTEVLLEELVRPEREALQKSVDFLGEQLQRVQAELTELDNRISKFREENPAFDPQVRKLKIEAHSNWLRELVRAEADLAGASTSGGGGGGRLAGLEARLRRLKEVYTPNHPSVIAMEEELRSARRTLGDGGVKKRAPSRTPKAMQEQVEFLTKKVDESLAELQTFAELENRSKELTTARAAKAQLFEKLLQRHEEALVSRSLVMQEKATQIRVVERPLAPQMSAKSKLVFVLAIGVIAGLVLGLGLVFCLEFLDRTVRVPAEVTRHFGVPVLGRLPDYGKTEDKKA